MIACCYRTAGEGAAAKSSKPPKPLKGGYSFTERLAAHQTSLLGVFRLLSIQDLLSASRVCRSWRAVADDRSLVSQLFVIFIIWYIVIHTNTIS